MNNPVVSAITKSFLSISAAVSLFFLSVAVSVSSAQSSFQGQGSDKLAFVGGSFGKGLEVFGTIVNLGTTIAVSLAFLFFFFNLFKFIKAGGDNEKEEAKGKMVWSTVAIIIIVSLWGIIAFVRAVFGIDSGQDAQGPVFVPGTKLQGDQYIQQGGGLGGS